MKAGAEAGSDPVFASDSAHLGGISAETDDSSLPVDETAPVEDVGVERSALPNEQSESLGDTGSEVVSQSANANLQEVVDSSLSRIEEVKGEDSATAIEHEQQQQSSEQEGRGHDDAYSVPAPTTSDYTEQSVVPPEDNMEPSSAVPADLKYFIGGFHAEVTEDDLRNHFSRFGTVVDANVTKDSMSGRSRGFGFITMSDTASREAILAETEHIIGGRKVSVRPYADQADIKNSFTDGPILKRKLFVGGVNPALGEDSLSAYFKRFGELEKITIMRDADGRSRGFGFVVFKEEDFCRKALMSRHHNITSRDRVEVRPCESRTKLSSTRGGHPLMGGPGPRGPLGYAPPYDAMGYGPPYHPHGVARGGGPQHPYQPHPHHHPHGELYGGPGIYGGMGGGYGVRNVGGPHGWAGEAGSMQNPWAPYDAYAASYYGGSGGWVGGSPGAYGGIPSAAQGPPAGSAGLNGTYAAPPRGGASAASSGAVYGSGRAGGYANGGTTYEGLCGGVYERQPVSSVVSGGYGLGRRDVAGAAPPISAAATTGSVPYGYAATKRIGGLSPIGGSYGSAGRGRAAPY